ncbi:alpha/beta fold hydrolase [Paraburkholderia silvatlantica]|uniref:Microsomal epoxide hydrolase n=1 Tax=Paraburkholderia silvatlantica TaxID=321895 RepID=A0ABR6FJA9_9BURK|nr:alpha/beta hydrolase [Paraburkholderia silvatlantica]MBB2927516.1 microsomal epoxide hydrolase [Paraburkholderia silvatlantica]PVY36228.1 microsomal epoxide hydrolase [Paraburkholderia silvatlantica]PXW40356.1 microsomal epoxide hydrolase [Paraburkholderia silvatlantica]
MNTPSHMIDHGPASLPDPILPGFEHRFATIEGTRLHYVIGGNKDGETVVLLAGYPESWFAWRKVMPLLAERYRVIVPDLPGQGDSDRPQGGYDTQSLATSLHALLEKLEAHRYHLAAHDVGAWVAYPYAALFGDEVSKLALLDAGIPGITLPEALPVAPERAWRTWHFAFHAIPDLPELLIAGKERTYLEWFLRRKTANPQTFTDADIDEYLRVFTREGGLRAGLAYYRAADVSARQNRELSTRGKLRMPVLALSADLGSIADMAGPLRDYADEVRGATIAWCGHFLPEEQPAAVAEELLRFFGQP